MTEQRVRIEITNGVADVRLARPDKRNALDGAMFAGLVTAGERLKSEPGVRAVVLSGEGPDFCAGLDFGMFEAMRDGERLSLKIDLPPSHGPARAAGQRAAYIWTQIPVPVIAAVTGNALGGGLQIALGADIRIVAPDASLSVLEISWGLVPDMTGTQRLPELVGRDVAKELTFSGRIVRGQEAVALGLATRIDPDPLKAALELARSIAGCNPHAVRAAKRLLDLAGRVDLETGFAAEQEEIGALIGSPNQAEALAARFGKRPARFTDPALPLYRLRSRCGKHVHDSGAAEPRAGAASSISGSSRHERPGIRRENAVNTSPGPAVCRRMTATSRPAALGSAACWAAHWPCSPGRRRPSIAHCRVSARTRSCGSRISLPTCSWPSRTAGLARCADPTWPVRSSAENRMGPGGQIFARAPRSSSRSGRVAANRHAP